MISFSEFRSMILEDEWVANKLRQACQQQLKQANNMKNLTSRHSEYVAVKVALGVLLLLFVLNMVEPGLADVSPHRGLRACNNIVRSQLRNASVGEVLPVFVQEQVKVFMKGVGGSADTRTVLYLDLDCKIHCNEIVPGGQSCTNASSFSGRRNSLAEVDAELQATTFRSVDLVLVRYPDFTNRDVSQEELEALTQAIAVLYDRWATELEAWMSLATTVLVIIVIFGGVVLLTKDLTFLSRNLLKPLRDLADDMKSIAHLQLAGVDCVEEEEEDTNNGKETAEVLLIRRTFSNMKKAIKSWGKYVPWPVVQLLLRANVEAELEVEERDVTMFFSDIVGFTTIVEGVEPDKSLLLLSRYFNDMSKVIDDHGGVVLEFIGDAIQCIYGAPLTNEHHPQSAVEASLRMLSALRKMKDWSRAKGLPEVDIRCGIHTGRVLVGNMGFHSRMKFGIVGEESNIPSKLEELNKAYKTHILISQSTFERLEPNAFLLRPIDYVHLRQRIEGAPGELIYEVLPPSWKRSSLVVNRLITLHTNAIAEYRSRKFASARQNFEQVNALVLEMTAEEDGPSLLMARRCEKCLQRSPQESWDGTWESVESEPLVEL